MEDVHLRRQQHRTQTIRACGIQDVTNDTDTTTFYVDNVFPMVRHLIPYYHGKNWATTKTSPYLDAYKTFIQALGDHLKNNSDMQFVAIGHGALRRESAGGGCL